jgi:hypothetical protein
LVERGESREGVGQVQVPILYYIHSVSDRLISYSNNELKYIREPNKGKAFVANNTLNFDDFPEICNSNEEIKKVFGIPFKKVDHLVEVFRNLDVPEDDIRALKEKIVYLIQNDDVRVEFGRNARNDILRNASPADMFGSFMDCINSLSLTLTSNSK